MKEENLLSENLKAYQNARRLSLIEFSKELDIPKSTLRGILKDGNTTLVTAIHISQNLGIGLDTLVYDRKFSDKQFIQKHMEGICIWLDALPDEKRQRIAALLAEIWDVISK